MTEPQQRAAPVAWVLVGALVTLGIVMALRYTQPSPAPATTATMAAAPSPPPTSSARAEFADLYLDYLLKTYYVYERGFCKALLEAICQSLLETKLLSRPATCERVPNAELVLAIGRYQHDTGIPVDGKAGPETVRRMLGGGFKSRRAMAQKYCPGWRPPGPAPSTSTPAPDATVAW